MEEFHTKERFYFRDEPERFCPAILAVVIYDISKRTSRNSTHRTVRAHSLVRSASNIQPGQLRDALEEFAKVFHLTPTCQLDSRYPVADTGEIHEESSDPLRSMPLRVFNGRGGSALQDRMALTKFWSDLSSFKRGRVLCGRKVASAAVFAPIDLKWSLEVTVLGEEYGEVSEALRRTTNIFPVSA